MTQHKVFIDLETTGLTPGDILELSFVVTDNELNEIVQFNSLVRPLNTTHKNFGCEPKAASMHTNNGLIRDLSEALEKDQLPHPFEVEKEVVNIFRSLNDGNRKNLVFVGNSLAGVDLPFLRSCMPRVTDEVHYRSIDVSGLRLALEMIFGEDPEYPKERGHRALADVRECIAEFKFLREFVMNKSKEA